MLELTLQKCNNQKTLVCIFHCIHCDARVTSSSFKNIWLCVVEHGLRSAADAEGVVHVCRLLSSALMVALSLSTVQEESRCVNMIKCIILW